MRICTDMCSDRCVRFKRQTVMAVGRARRLTVLQAVDLKTDGLGTKVSCRRWWSLGLSKGFLMPGVLGVSGVTCTSTCWSPIFKIRYIYTRIYTTIQLWAICFGKWYRKQARCLATVHSQVSKQETNLPSIKKGLRTQKYTVFIGFKAYRLLLTVAFQVYDHYSHCFYGFLEATLVWKDPGYNTYLLLSPFYILQLSSVGKVHLKPHFKRFSNGTYCCLRVGGVKSRSSSQGQQRNCRERFRRWFQFRPLEPLANRSREGCCEQPIAEGSRVVTSASSCDWTVSWEER